MPARSMTLTVVGESGSKVMPTSQKYAYLAVLNHSTDATLYFMGGTKAVQPPDAIQVPAGADLSFPIAVPPGDWNLSVWWTSPSGLAQQVTLYVSDEPVYLGPGNPGKVNATIVNVPNVNVANTPGVNVESMPAVEIAANQSVTVEALPAITIGGSNVTLPVSISETVT